jgi:thioredoxin 1
MKLKLPKNIVWYALIVIMSVYLIRYYIITHPSGVDVNTKAIRMVANDKDMKSILDSAGSKLMVFDLYAEWCGPCRAIDPAMKKLADKYAGKVEFYKVNIDNNPQTAELFRTKVIPYVVFFKNNKMITAVSGVHSIDRYEKIISVCADSTAECDKIMKKI